MNVLKFPESVLPENALMQAAKVAIDQGLTDAIIIGHDSDGELALVVSGSVSCQEALWLLETAKGIVLSPGEW